MTRGRIRQYSEAVQGRYLRAAKKEKGRILDEFTNVTACHRKAAIRLLRRGKQSRRNKRRGRPRRYGPAAAEALRVVWEATDRVCSKRLHPFLPELVEILRRNGDKTITVEIEVALRRMSPATIDRLLRSYRRLGGRRPFATNYLIGGGDSLTLHRILGHETLEMTRRYVDQVASQVTVLRARHSPGDRLVAQNRRRVRG